MNDVRQLVEAFATQLAALVQRQAIELARAAVDGALGGRKPGRPSSASLLLSPSKPRKKPPIQFCPVPGCKNPAAPVFGMVCSEHRDVPKTKIRKYREARRAAKAGNAPKPARTKVRTARGPLARKRTKRKPAARKPAAKAGRMKPVARRKARKRPASKPAPVTKVAPDAAPESPPPAAAA